VQGKNANFCLTHSGALSVTPKVPAVNSPCFPLPSLLLEGTVWKSWAQPQPAGEKETPPLSVGSLQLEPPRPGSPHFNLSCPLLCWHGSRWTRSPCRGLYSPGCARGHPRVCRRTSSRTGTGTGLVCSRP